MPDILVINARKLSDGAGRTLIYVGRRTSYKPEYGVDFSILGNPFSVAAGYTRDEAVDAYAQRVLPLAVRRALDVLRQRAQDERLALVCFCAPRRCHADVIKAWLDGES